MSEDILYEYAITSKKSYFRNGEIETKSNLDRNYLNNKDCKIFEPVKIVRPKGANWELVSTTCDDYSINWHWRREFIE